MSKLEWFAALHQGDCVKINILLDQRNELLFMCPDESEAEKIGPGWKGCNALHVAVKQGCSQLVMRVLDKAVEDYRQIQHRNMSPTTIGSIDPPRIDTYERLRDMILAFEGNCKLDTIAIALLNGDRDITWLLANALLEKCQSNPYGFELGSERPGPSGCSVIDADQLGKIRDITEEVLGGMRDGKAHVEKFYKQQCEFNFLPMKEYLFLALCSYCPGKDYSSWFYKRNNWDEKVETWNLEVHIPAEREVTHIPLDQLPVLYLFLCRWAIARETLRKESGKELLKFLFQLEDGRGRTALHIGIDHLSIGDLLHLLEALLSSLVDSGELTNTRDRAGWVSWHHTATEFRAELTNPRDRAGRTPLHRAAAAFDFPEDLRGKLVENGANVDLSFEFKTTSADCFVDVRKVSTRNGFTQWFPYSAMAITGDTKRESMAKGILLNDHEYLAAFPITAEHLAIFNPFIRTVDFGSKTLKSPKISIYSVKPYLEDYLAGVQNSFGLNVREFSPFSLDARECFSPFGLAALVGNIKFLRNIIAKDITFDNIIPVQDIIELEIIPDARDILRPEKTILQSLMDLRHGISAWAWNYFGMELFRRRLLRHETWGWAWNYFGMQLLQRAWNYVGTQLLQRELLRGEGFGTQSRYPGLHLAAAAGFGIRSCYPGLHLAAAAGDPLGVQTILKTNKVDLLEIWLSRSPAPLTAMHAAVEGWPEIDLIGKNLLHVVNFQNGWCKKVKDYHGDRNVEGSRYNRQACVNLLLQAGASVWDHYGRDDAPSPGPSTSPEFRAWWSERVERETQEMKNGLTTAANAVSVTAALVATAAYIGPLQPPMGYAADGGLVHVGELTVKIFILFDTLAFYVALSAIVLAMIPALPMLTESVQSEGKRARRSVLSAVILLVISIMCILIAFAAASISVTSDDASWNHGHVAFSTLIVGGFICTVAMCEIVRRVLPLIKSWIRSTNLYRGLLIYRMTRDIVLYNHFWANFSTHAT